MKGLERIPTRADLLSAYNTLYSNRKCSPKKLATISQWCRFDARLAEILLDYIYKNWRLIDPVLLHGELAKLPWPEAIGPILTQVLSLFARSERSHFRPWVAAVTHGFSMSKGEIYFIGQFPLAGLWVDRQVQRSQSAFRRWGYYSEDSLLSKSHTQKSFSKDQRLKLIAVWLESNESFSISDYLRLIKNCVSRRQAERDLQNNPLIRHKGFTRSRRYFRAK